MASDELIGMSLADGPIRSLGGMRGGLGGSLDERGANGIGQGLEGGRSGRRADRTPRREVAGVRRADGRLVSGEPRSSETAGPATALVAVVGLLLSTCGPGVHDLSVQAEPLLEVRGRVDRSLLRPGKPDSPLLAVLVWAGRVAVHPLCLTHPDEPLIAAGCPDPYGVFTGDLEMAVPLDLDSEGTFALVLPRLPKINVSVGDAVTRIAYGSLLVVEDVDGDGVANYVAQATQTQGRRPGGGPAEEPAPALPTDRVLAASFFNLKRPQQRLVFREGG